MRGRPPTPTALKVLNGNPGKRPLNGNEPQFEELKLDPPEEIAGPEYETARKEWCRVVPQLVRAGVAKRIDTTALTAYCIQYQTWLEAERFVRDHGFFVKTKTGLLMMNPYAKLSRVALEAMCRFMSEFGLTPSARVRLKAELPANADPFGEFLGERRKA